VQQGRSRRETRKSFEAKGIRFETLSPEVTRIQGFDEGRRQRLVEGLDARGKRGTMRSGVRCRVAPFRPSKRKTRTAKLQDNTLGGEFCSDGIFRAVGALEKIASTIAAVFMFAIMIIVFGDVIMRYAFTSRSPGRTNLIRSI